MADGNFRLAVWLFATVVSIHGLATVASLEDYQKRVVVTRSTVGELRDASIEEQADADYQDAKIRTIRNLLPRSEIVEGSSGETEVDNRWLHNDLDILNEKYNLNDRMEILGRIDERLRSIQVRIVELISATAATTTKDEDKRLLAEILAREEYQKAAPADESLFQKWIREFVEWLAKMFPKLNIDPSPAGGMGSLSFVLQVLLFVLLAAAIGFFIYRFLPMFAGRNPTKGSHSKSDRIILGERIGDMESASDLFAEAERLARNGELRLAIRKAYIATLCDLGDRNIIGLARHKTNRDYLRDVSSRRELSEDLGGMTGDFENYWYGSLETDSSAWERFRERYYKTRRGARQTT